MLGSHHAEIFLRSLVVQFSKVCLERVWSSKFLQIKKIKDCIDTLFTLGMLQSISGEFSLKLSQRLLGGHWKPIKSRIFRKGILKYLSNSIHTQLCFPDIKSQISQQSSVQHFHPTCGMLGTGKNFTYSNFQRPTCSFQDTIIILGQVQESSLLLLRRSCIPYACDIKLIY